jgi:hypothetical protein
LTNVFASPHLLQLLVLHWREISTDINAASATRHLLTDHKVVMNTLQILDLLPNLEFLQIAYMSAQGHRHTRKDTLPTKTLRVVAFRESTVRRHLLQNITSNQHLESFLYIPGHATMVAGPSAYFSGRQVASYLGSSQKSFRFLSSYLMTDTEHPGKCRQLYSTSATDSGRYSRLRQPRASQRELPRHPPWYRRNRASGRHRGPAQGASSYFTQKVDPESFVSNVTWVFDGR